MIILSYIRLLIIIIITVTSMSSYGKISQQSSIQISKDRIFIFKNISHLTLEVMEISLTMAKSLQEDGCHL